MFKTRLLSGIVLVLVALLTICSGGTVLYMTVLCLSLIGAGELFRVMKVREDKWNLLEITGYAGVVIFYLSLLLHDPMYQMLALILDLVLLMAVYVFTYPKYNANQVMPAFFAIVYVGVMLSYVYQTRMLDGGKFHVWLIFLCSWGCDTCAYCVGVLFGKHKMAPVLSPKKSVEGAVGGVVGAILLGIIYAAATKGGMVEYAIICGVGALISMVGDLAASAIKRNQGIKDYGKLIPGHGTDHLFPVGASDSLKKLPLQHKREADGRNWNMKKIAILGSTGSIGTQTLDVVRANGDLEVVGISAGSNITLLEQQIREFHPKFAAVGDEAKAAELRDRVKDLPVKIGSGMDGMIELATMPESEILVTAIVGMIGIRPTVAAMKAGKDIALANKETLVTAGHIIMPLAEECGVQILPVDSEHSAIFQCLHGENRKEIEKLLITASGGPFRGKTRAELENVTVEQALRHPNWSMGHKITIDSATLVNKGLEVMEAKWLFGVDLDHIQVVVQPKSIIHSMVEFKDGAVMAQLGTPDMKLPIQYALYYPERRFLAGDRLDFAALTQITFEKPDMDTFLGLPMAMQASRTGGSMPTVFNAANERAVALFLAKKIRFLEIYDVIAGAMEAHKTIADPTLEQILAAEQETYEWIANRYKMGE